MQDRNPENGHNHNNFTKWAKYFPIAQKFETTSGITATVYDSISFPKINEMVFLKQRVGLMHCNKFLTELLKNYSTVVVFIEYKIFTSYKISLLFNMHHIPLLISL